MRPGAVLSALFLVALLFVLIKVSYAKKSLVVNNQQTDQHLSILHQGRERYFTTHFPAGLKKRSGLPAVIVLHGGGGTPQSVARLTRFNQLADRENFIVVYPQAINRHWNDGRAVAEFRSHQEGVDDVGFINSLIDTLITKFGVDSSRVYAAGISNGGMMCQRLGREIPHRFAAIATVAAAMPENLASCPATGTPVPILMIHGTADRVVPFHGGVVALSRPRGRVLGVEQTLAFWVNWNRCAPLPADTWLTEPGGSLPVKLTVYKNHRNGVRVVLYTVVNGGHTWPGGRRRPVVFGKKTDAINATAIIWEFFQGHRR